MEGKINGSNSAGNSACARASVRATRMAPRHNGLRTRFTQQCQEIQEKGRRMDGDELLRYYTNQFEVYASNASSTDRISNYLNR